MSINIYYLLLGVLVLFNLMTFLYVGADKKRSRDNDERIPEVNFFVLSIFFGSLGILTGMFFFHHKTQKFNFVFGISALLLEQIVLLWFLIRFLN